jgi:LysR family glycine cleavage system transcriptional activator
MLASGRLVAPFEQRIRTSESFYLTCPTHQYLHPNAEAFWSWLIEEAETEDGRLETASGAGS